MLKPTLGLDEQLELLKSRNLQIKDDKAARAYLAENSYYHLNIYFKEFQLGTYMVDNRGKPAVEFIEGTTFDDIIRAHENDKIIRNIYLSAILPIELRLRTIISYYLGNTLGSECFYFVNDKSIYPFKDKISKLHVRFEETVEASSSNPIVQHHTLHYQSKFPLYAIFELTSLNFLKDYFDAVSWNYQNKISQTYFKQKTAAPIRNWMSCLCDLRNICAHQNHLYRRLFNSTPIFPYDKALYGSNRLTLFAYTIMMGYLSSPKDWKHFIATLENMDKDRNMLNFKDYGFGSDWRDRLLSVPQLIHPA